MPIDTESMVMVAIEKLDSSVTRLDEKVDKMGEVLAKQELLFERMLSIDEKVDRNNKLVHKRLDAHDARLKVTENRQNIDGCPAFQAFRNTREEQLKAFYKEVDIAREERREIIDRVAAIEKKPAEALGMFIKGVLTSLGAAVAGWLTLKGLK